MRYKEAQGLKDKQFCCRAGVRKAVFAQMLAVLETAHAEKKARGGRPNKLSLEDTLMMTLEYLRGYHTFSQAGASFGISESYACKLVHWTKSTLMGPGRFSLPGQGAPGGDAGLSPRNKGVEG